MGRLDLRKLIQENKKATEQLTQTSNLSLHSLINEELQKTPQSRDIQLGQYGVGESKYDEGVTPENVSQLGEIRAQRQPLTDKWANGITKAAGIAGSSILENTGGLLYGIGSAIHNEDISRLYKNDFTDSLDEMNDYIAKAMPNYHTKAEEDYNLAQKLGTANFWSEQALSGAAYMGAAIATGWGLNKYASLAKLAKSGKLINETTLATEGLVALDDASRGIKIANAVDFGKNAALMSHGESAIESRQIYNDTKDQLILDYKDKHNGEEPNDEALKQIDNASKAAGNWGYASNLAITGTTNALLFPKLLSQGFKANKLKLNDIELVNGKYIPEAKGILRGVSIEGLKGSLEEGSQELGQLLTQKTLTDYYSQGFKDKKDQHGMIESLVEGFKQTLGTEGLENFFLGALMGGPASVIQAKGEISAQNQATQKAAELLNNPEVKKTINTFSNFVRATNYEKEKTEALINNSKFDYLNAEFNQNKSIAKQFIDNNATELLISQYEDLKGLSEEEFKKVAGYPIEKPLPHSKEQIINDAISLVKTLDKTNNSIHELFPYKQEVYESPEKYNTLTTNLWHYSTSISNIDKRVKQIHSDIYKIAAENDATITGLGTPESPFTVDGNPMVAQQVNQANKDLHLAKLYKDKLIESYNLLADPKTQKKTLNDIIDTSEEESKESNIVEEIPLPKVTDEPLISKSKASKEIQDFVQKIMDTESLTDPKDLQFYENNKAEIEKELKFQTTPQSTKVDNEPIISNVESPTTINEDPLFINKEFILDDSNDVGRKANTPFKTNGGIDNGQKPSEDRYFKTTETIVLDEHKLLVVTKATNPELYSQILDNDPTAKEYEKKHPDFKGVWTILVDKENNPVLEEDKFIQSTLETAQRISDNKIDIGRGLSKEDKSKAKEKAIKDLNSLRDEILLLKNNDVKYLPIIGKSNGLMIETDENANIIHSAFEDKINGERQSNNLLGRIFDKNIKYDEIPLTLPTFNLIFNNIKVLPGKLYTKDGNRRIFDLIPRNLNVDEASLIIDLINKKLNTKEKDLDFDPIDEIKKITTFFKSNKPSDIYINSDGRLVFDNNELTKEEIESNRSKIIDFLLTKKVNVNNKYIKGESFTKPDINGRGENVHYNEYLLSGEVPMFGTDLKPIVDLNGRPNRRFIQSYFIYDNKLIENKLKEKVDLETSERIEDNTSPIITEEIKPIKKEFKKRSGDKVLDRLKKRNQDRNKLSQEEINWFKERFPNIPINFIQGLIEQKSLGQFLSSGEVLLSDEATIGTLHHEAFHVITQLYLTKEEIDKLYNEASKKYSNKSRKELEEILAEDFVSYKLGGKVLNNSPQRNTIFRRILSFLKDLLGISSTNIQQVYERLDKGYYTNKKLVNTKEFSSLNRDENTKRITNEKGTKFVKDVLDGIDILFFDYIFDNGRTPVIANSHVNKITDKIHDIIDDKYQNSVDEKQIKDYEYILENWDDIINMWKTRININGVEIVTKIENNIEEIKNEDEELSKDEQLDEHSSKGDYSEGNLTSTLESISSPVRLLIRSLKQVNITNDLGFSIPVDFTSTYNYLLKNLAGTGNNYSDIYNKIESLIEFKPEFQELIDRLGAPSSDISVEQFRFQTQFTQDFNKNRYNAIVTIYEPNGNIIPVDTNRQNEAEKVKTIWEANLLLHTKQDEKGKLIINKDVINEKDPFVFLDKLGIIFDKNTQKIINDKDFNLNDLNDSVAAIKIYIDKKNGDVTNLYNSGKEEDGIAGRINYLLTLEANNTSLVNELSYMSTEGKTVYSVSDNNALSITTNIINNVNSIEELFLKLPHLNTVGAENSFWLNELFNPKTGLRNKNIKLNLELHDGVASSKESEDVSKISTRKGTKGDLFTQNIASILNGKSNYIVSADKSQEFVLGLSNKLPVSIELLKSGFNTIKLKEIFRGYFKSEFKGIALFKLDGIGTNVDGYSKNGSDFTIFNEILLKSSKVNIKEILKSKLDDLKFKEVKYNESKEELDELVNSLLPDLDKLVIDFFESYSRQLNNSLKENNINEFGIPKEYTDKYPKEQLIRAIVVTDFINSIEQTKLFIGNLAFYKDLYKRTAMFAGTKLIPRVDEETNDFLNKNFIRSDNKLADGNENSIVYNDVTTTKDIKELVDTYIKSGVSEEAAYNILGYEKTESEEFKGISAYGKADEGDAQGWGSLDFIREFHNRVGTWTNKMENAYQIIQKQKFDNEGNLIEGKLLTKDELTYFQTLKLQYAGPINHGSTQQLFVPGGYKFTIMPLIPQMVAGKNLSKLLENMKSNKSGIALFKSASKFGTILNKDGKANPFYTNNNHGEINNADLVIQSISYNYLGLQVKPSPPKDKYIFSTQFRKTMLINAFENGKETFEGAEKLLSTFSNLIEEKTKIEKDKLIKELGINPDTYVAEDVTKLVDMLVEYSENRKLTDNIINSLDIEEKEGKKVLKYNIDSMVNKTKLDSVLMSIIDARLIKQKYNGDAYVLGTVAGMEKLGNRPIGSNNALRGYTKDTSGNTLPAEVMIPLSESYYPLLKKFGSLKAVNEAIKNGDIPNKVLELVGCRIPGQGMNSNEYLTIKEFLPEDAATTMIVHPDIVAKAGSDFDNDKLYTYRPNLDENGNYIEDNIDNKTIQVIKDFISNPHNFISLITPNSTSIISPIVDDIKYIDYLNDKTEANNELISKGREPKKILTKEEYFEAQNSKDKKINYTALLKLQNKINARYKLWLAKDEVGLSAIANAYGPLSQLSGLTANKSYINAAGEEIKVNINLIHNEIRDVFNLGALKDAENNHNISEINNQLINIIVDAAKDEIPMVSYLNMTMDTLPIYLYLNKLGVPFEHIANFMTQPIILDYIEEINKNKSIFLKSTGKNQRNTEITKQIKKKYSNLVSEKDIENKILSLKELKDFKLIENQSTKEFELFQLQVFNDFLKYKEQASLFNDAVRVTNSDTAGLGQNINSSRLKLEEINKVQKTNFINGVNEIINKTFIKSFQQDEFAISSYKQFYDTQKEEIINNILGLANELENPFKSSRKEKLKMINLIENDFINFVIQNYGYKNINAIRKRLFEGENSVAKKLLELKNKKEENLNEDEKQLRNNILIKELFPLIDKAALNYDNVKIFTKKLDTFTSNQLTEAFRELKNSNLSLGNELIHVGILQSGLNNSPITYLGIIPFEYYNQLVKDSFEEFNKKNGAEILPKFNELFIRNNNKIVPTIFKNLQLSALGNGMYGKDYDVNKATKGFNVKYIPITTPLKITIENISPKVEPVKVGNLIVFEHGEDVPSSKDVINGQSDTNLTKEGKEQASNLGKELKIQGITSLITSPIERVIQTAEIIKKEQNIPYYTDENLKTMNMGNWEGEVKENEYDEKLWSNPINEEEKINPKAESFKQFRERALKAWNIIKKLDDKNVAILTSSKMIKMFNAYNQTNGIWNEEARNIYLSNEINKEENKLPIQEKITNIGEKFELSKEQYNELKSDIEFLFEFQPQLKEELLKELNEVHDDESLGKLIEKKCK